MFVYSFKASKRQILSMILCIVVLIAVLLAAILRPGGNAAAQTFQPVGGGNDQQRIAFLTGLGYEVDSASPTVKEILIPDEFDEVFAGYNDIQREAGSDLRSYHGKRVKCWTYRILNIPEQGEVLANLFVYKDKIIGGDISSTALDGFMHGLISHKDSKDKAVVPTGSTASQTTGTTVKQH